jgi:hypothetical protein
MQALGQIVKFGKEILALKGQLERNTVDIKEIREDLKQLATVVESLKHQVEMHQLKQENEFRIQRLELENILLKNSRQPSGNDSPPMLPPSE